MGFCLLDLLLNSSEFWKVSYTKNLLTIKGYPCISWNHNNVRLSIEGFVSWCPKPVNLAIFWSNENWKIFWFPILIPILALDLLISQCLLSNRICQLFFFLLSHTIFCTLNQKKKKKIVWLIDMLWSKKFNTLKTSWC